MKVKTYLLLIIFFISIYLGEGCVTVVKIVAANDKPNRLPNAAVLGDIAAGYIMARDKDKLRVQNFVRGSICFLTIFVADEHLSKWLGYQTFMETIFPEKPEPQVIESYGSYQDCLTGPGDEPLSCGAAGQ